MMAVECKIDHDIDKRLKNKFNKSIYINICKKKVKLYVISIHFYLLFEISINSCAKFFNVY